MPELPEVETTRRHLAEQLTGARIARVALPDPRAVARPAPEAFAAALTGGAVTAWRRRGKYLLGDLDDGHHLLVHRRMTGNLLLRAPGAPGDDHTVAVLAFADGRELRFCDRRRLGRLWLATPAEVAALDAQLGPEPLAPEFTPDVLARQLARRRGQLKPLLLDQRVVAGLGNIYADEALHAAGLHPTRLAHTLTPAEIARLHAAIRVVLEQGLLHEGTTFSDYRGAVGQPGRNQLLVAVFRKTGQPCARCGTPIARLRLGGRSTHYCAACQA